MAKVKLPTSKDLERLEKFFKRNDKLDPKTVNLNDNRILESFDWTGLIEEKEAILDLLKAYQRLVRIVPGGTHETVKALMKAGIHSATQIASLPRKHFILSNTQFFENNTTLAEMCYANAVACRSRLLVRFMETNSTGP